MENTQMKNNGDTHNAYHLLLNNPQLHSSKKTLYLVGGTMGVGKTTTCQILKTKLPNSVFLDGDWCWDMHPFQVTDETKQMVMENICYQLNNFLRCSAFDNVIFCWVMHEQPIIDDLLRRLTLGSCRVTPISLVCSEQALVKRLKKDVDAGLRSPDVIARSVKRIPLYQRLNTLKIDVSELGPDEVAGLIATL